VTQQLTSGGGTLAVVLVVLLTAGSALTATISDTPASSAEHHESAGPAFTLISGPTYADASGPTTVSFVIDPAAGQARARVDDGSAPDWSDCTSADGTTWSCAVHSTSGTFEWLAVP
jgi:hypothetical protein